MREQFKEAFILGLMQFASWGICTMSWRAVSQANIPASIVTDTTLASLQYFVFRRMIKNQEASGLVPWFGYTFGGVVGTITGIYGSLWWFGK
jgi:ABC-type enterochelin transport system permease subunit